MKYIPLFACLLLFMNISCKSTSNIIGKWEVESSEIENFSMPPDCKNIPVGALFYFNADSTLTIYTNDSVYMQGKYFIDGKSIHINASDVVYTVGIAKAGKNELILLHRHLPQQMMIDWKKEYDEYKRKGFRIILKRQ